MASIRKYYTVHGKERYRVYIHTKKGTISKVLNSLEEAEHWRDTKYEVFLAQGLIRSKSGLRSVRYLTLEERQRIQEMVQKGLYFTDIALALEKSVSCIAYELHKNPKEYDAVKAHELTQENMRKRGDKPKKSRLERLNESISKENTHQHEENHPSVSRLAQLEKQVQIIQYQLDIITDYLKGERRNG